MQKNITPLPWAISQSTPTAVVALDATGTKKLVVAMLGTREETRSYECRSADAAFIVKACNLHDELVEALKAALPWVGGLANENPSVVEVCKKVRDALVKLEVK